MSGRGAFQSLSAVLPHRHACIVDQMLRDRAKVGGPLRPHCLLMAVASLGQQTQISSLFVIYANGGLSGDSHPTG